MIKEEAIGLYGKEMWEKMIATGWLDGITCVIREDGKIDIPEYDLDRAHRAATGKPIIWM